MDELLRIRRELERLKAECQDVELAWLRQRLTDILSGKA